MATQNLGIGGTDCKTTSKLLGAEQLEALWIECDAWI
jgi:hypothetical protein